MAYASLPIALALSVTSNAAGHHPYMEKGKAFMSSLEIPFSDRSERLGRVPHPGQFMLTALHAVESMLAGGVDKDAV